MNRSTTPRATTPRVAGSGFAAGLYEFDRLVNIAVVSHSREIADQFAETFNELGKPSTVVARVFPIAFDVPQFTGTNGTNGKGGAA